MDKISVIIPCYNYGKYLSDAVDSSLRQTYQNIEILIADDCSTDNTHEVAMKYLMEEKVKIGTADHNTGLSAARNAAISWSDGDWIFPLDADDMIADDCLERLLKKAKEDNLDIVCPGQQEFGGSKRFRVVQDKLDLDAFKETNQIHASCLFRKKIWEEIGGYDETMRQGHEDWDFWLRAVHRGYKVGAINDPMFFYRVHSDSMIHKVGNKHFENRDYILKKINII